MENVVNSKVYDLLRYVNPIIFIDGELMTDIEKENNINYKNIGGYYKNIGIKAAFKDAWNNYKIEDKKEFLNFPNFDWKIFTEITGIEEEII